MSGKEGESEGCRQDLLERQQMVNTTVQSMVLDMEFVVISLSEGLTKLTTALYEINAEGMGVGRCIRECFSHLYSLCVLLQISLGVLIEEKLKINKLKYNADICKKRKSITKYTEDAKATGFVEVLVFHTVVQRQKTFTGGEISCGFQDAFPRLMNEVASFAKDRGWMNMYSRKSLAFYLLGELGELSEVLNTLPSSMALHSLPVESFNATCSEVADIAIYLLHACREYDISLEP